jgi:hypothetical protein
MRHLPRGQQAGLFPLHWLRLLPFEAHTGGEFSLHQLLVAMSLYHMLNIPSWNSLLAIRDGL